MSPAAQTLEGRTRVLIERVLDLGAPFRRRLARSRRDRAGSSSTRPGASPVRPFRESARSEEITQTSSCARCSAARRSMSASASSAKRTARSPYDVSSPTPSKTTTPRAPRIGDEARQAVHQLVALSGTGWREGCCSRRRGRASAPKDDAATDVSAAIPARRPIPARRSSAPETTPMSGGPHRNPRYEIGRDACYGAPPLPLGCPPARRAEQDRGRHGDAGAAEEETDESDRGRRST